MRDIKGLLILVTASSNMLNKVMTHLCCHYAWSNAPQTYLGTPKFTKFYCLLTLLAQQKTSAAQKTTHASL